MRFWSTDLENEIRYLIDESDAIRAVSVNWDQFALENDAPAELLSDVILQRSIWEFVSGDAIEHVYRAMLAKARSGESLAFAFRCDSPALRRFLTLQIAPIGEGSVEFITETVCTEEREIQSLFDINSPKDGEFIVACSWCNKLKTGVNDWSEAEDAVAKLGLFEAITLPALSHGMCEGCYDVVMSKMPDRQNAV